MSIAGLSKRLGKQWPAIETARAEAVKQLGRLKALLEQHGMEAEDVNVVVFGSLARREWTSGSDLDWTLLIDGQADHTHAHTAHELNTLLKAEGFLEPGATQTFGNLAFSHELIHQIGGLDDSNRNTTRRLLLLLESTPVNRREAYDRVITGVLRRYLQNDFRPFRLKVPRFLLNDLNRFWRTMCVDYGSKYFEQAGKKWALRNVKLRLSRKLIFVSGLITCLSCDPEWIQVRSSGLAAEPTVDGLVQYLRGFVAQAPLDILAETCLAEARDDTAALLFDTYDTFLAKLDQKVARAELESLAPGDSTGLFQEMQDLANRFEDGLERLFFEDSKRLIPLIRRYGVF